MMKAARRLIGALALLFFCGAGNGRRGSCLCGSGHVDARYPPITGTFNQQHSLQTARRSQHSGAAAAIILWDADTGRVKTRLFRQYAQGNPAFSPDGAEFAHGILGGDILIRDAETGELKAKLEEHNDSINARIYGRDGKTLFSAGDGLLHWDVEKRKLIKRMRSKTYAALTLSSDRSNDRCRPYLRNLRRL